MTEKEFEIFFHRNWKGHFWFAQKMLPFDIMIAEDATAIAYGKAWEMIKRTNENRPGAINNYIKETIKSKIKDYYKQSGRAYEAKKGLSWITDTQVEAWEIKSELMATMLSDLSIREKEVISLFSNGFKICEISKLLKIVDATARVLLNRGLGKIRHKMGAERVSGRICKEGHKMLGFKSCPTCNANRQRSNQFPLFANKKSSPYTI